MLFTQSQRPGQPQGPCTGTTAAQYQGTQAAAQAGHHGTHLQVREKRSDPGVAGAHLYIQYIYIYRDLLKDQQQGFT